MIRFLKYLFSFLNPWHSIHHKLDKIMSDLTNLTTQVDRTITLEQQAITILTSQPPDQQPAIDDLTTRLTTSNDALESALTPPPKP